MYCFSILLQQILGSEMKLHKISRRYTKCPLRYHLAYMCMGNVSSMNLWHVIPQFCMHSRLQGHPSCLHCSATQLHYTRGRCVYYVSIGETGGAFNWCHYVNTKDNPLAHLLSPNPEVHTGSAPGSAHSQTARLYDYGSMSCYA